MLIRSALPADLPAITVIYAHHVRHGTGTFELEAPDHAEMLARWRSVVDGGWPWLVAEHEGRVQGYAYAAPFRPRPAYRYCLEDSVYVASDAQGQGVGRLLMIELVGRCTARGARQMLAVIGDADNHGSIALHRSLGFTPTGTLAHAGWKFGRWLDVVLMQRRLGLGESTDPS